MNSFVFAFFHPLLSLIVWQQFARSHCCVVWQDTNIPHSGMCSSLHAFISVCLCISRNGIARLSEKSNVYFWNDKSVQRILGMSLLMLVLGTVLTPWSSYYYYFCSTSEEVETFRGEVICPQSQIRKAMQSQAVEFGLSDVNLFSLLLQLWALSGSRLHTRFFTFVLIYSNNSIMVGCIFV